MPGLGHDELERALGVAEVGRGAAPEVVELQPGVVAQQDAAAIIAEAGPGRCAGRCRGALAGCCAALKMPMKAAFTTLPESDDTVP